MELKIMTNVLVIAGLWNTGIFNPNWIKKYLFPDNEFKIEFFIDNNNQAFTRNAIRVSSGDIMILIADNRLNFIPIKANDKTFEFIQELSIKITDYLIHTPVSAFGVNFVFKEQINDDLQLLFNLKSFAKLKELGASIKTNYIAHEFEYEEKKLD